MRERELRTFYLVTLLPRHSRKATGAQICVDERRFENVRGGRVLSSPNPFIVVCRKVQQTSLGKFVGVLRKEATAFGMRFQKIRVHGNTPLNNPINFAQRTGSIYVKAPLLILC
jgi:hypothetical protein